MRLRPSIASPVNRATAASPGVASPGICGRGRRSAYTLIEMLAVLAVGSALLGTATATLYLVFRAESGGRQQLLLATTLDRLAEQFRRDVHEADAITPRQPGAWEFRQPGGRTVEYRPGKDCLVRLELVCGRPERREEYALPTGAEVAIESPPQGRPGLAVLRITVPVDQTAAAARRGVRIEAALGFDQRFSVEKEGQPDAPKSK